MSVLVIGGRGNMGRRYRAVLDYLSKDCDWVDIEHHPGDIVDKMAEASGVIIATPTHTHLDWIRALLQFKKPILCEKPLGKNVAAVKAMLTTVKASGIPFDMVCQYKELLPEVPTIGETYYNYWNHGKDGLAWDCIQPIGLARSDIYIEEKSPIWRCRINGYSLKLQDMDRAYVRMIDKWMKEPRGDLGKIISMHEKVEAFDRSVRRAVDQ